MLQSSVQMESSRSSTQTISTTFSNVLQTFVQLAFVEAIKIRIDLLVEKILFTSFCGFRKIRFKCYSPIQMESSHSSTQTIRTTFSNFLQTFLQLAFVEDMKIRNDLLE